MLGLLRGTIENVVGPKFGRKSPITRLVRSNRFFFFVSRWNRAIFGRRFSMWRSTKRCSSIFDLGPLTPKIYFQKFGPKSPISRLVWQIDRRCLGLLRGFRGSPIQWNHRKCCGAEIDSSFFVFRWSRAVFGRPFSMWRSTKLCSSIFDLGPLTPKIYYPKFGTKSPISPLVWQIDRRCLHLAEGFSGMADSMQP